MEKQGGHRQLAALDPDRRSAAEDSANPMAMLPKGESEAWQHTKSILATGMGYFQIQGTCPPTLACELSN